MRNRKRRYLQLGEISSGTLRMEDLIPEVLYLAGTVRMSREDRNKVRKLAAEFHAAPEDWEDAPECYAELCDVVEAYAPPFAYLGSLDGDGACIGVWLGDMQDIRDSEDVWEDSQPEPAEWTYRLSISDHGNCTLYDRRGREIWGVV